MSNFPATYRTCMVGLINHPERDFSPFTKICMAATLLVCGLLITGMVLSFDGIAWCYKKIKEKLR